MSVTMVILNYKRPWNLDQSMPILSAFKSIHHIMVLNGHPDHTWKNKMKFKNVSVYDDFANNDKYFACRRYLAMANIAETEYVMTLDDDELPSETLIDSMVSKIKNDDTTWYGPLVRTCDDYGYDTNMNRQDYNVVLNPTVVAKRYVKRFVDEFLVGDVAKFIKLTKGNGDDLIFNHYMRKITNRNPERVYAGNLTFMDHSGGYHQMKTHYLVRTLLCKQLDEDETKILDVLKQLTNEQLKELGISFADGTFSSNSGVSSLSKMQIYLIILSALSFLLFCVMIFYIIKYKNNKVKNKIKIA